MDKMADGVFLGRSCVPEIGHVNCDLCRDPSPTTVWLGSSGFQVVQCKWCGLLFTNPRPGPDAIQGYYADAYYAHGNVTLGFWAAMRQWKYEIMRQVAFDHLGYATRQGCEFPATRKLIRAVLARLFREKFSRVPPYRQGGRALDIGCGDGEYVRLLESLGWNAFGIEPSAKAVAHAHVKGCKQVLVGTLDKIRFHDGFFDLITLWDVLEHTHSPVDTLREVRRILREEGIVYVKVPNANCLEERVFQERWVGLDLPRHLYFFTPATLARVMDKAGFEITSLQFVSAPNILADSLIVWLRERARWFVGGRLRLALILLSVPAVLTMDALRIGNTIQAVAVPRRNT